MPKGTAPFGLLTSRPLVQDIGWLRGFRRAVGLLLQLFVFLTVPNGFIFSVHAVFNGQVSVVWRRGQIQERPSTSHLVLTDPFQMLHRQLENPHRLGIEMQPGLGHEHIRHDQGRRTIRIEKLVLIGLRRLQYQELRI